MKEKKALGGERLRQSPPCGPAQCRPGVSGRPCQWLPWASLPERRARSWGARAPQGALKEDTGGPGQSCAASQRFPVLLCNSVWTTMIVDCHSFTALEQSPQRDTGLDRRLSTCTDTITSTVGEFRGEIREMRDP